jgi:hypothetical protein
MNDMPRRLKPYFLLKILEEYTDENHHLKMEELRERFLRYYPEKPERKGLYDDFAALAQQAGSGFRTLTYEHSGAVFAGSLLPVKELAWAKLYTSMGILGITMPLTGEAAVNPMIPSVALPFTMCHEMCHRTCIAVEGDANMGAFLACKANSDPIFQYSGYFMAFRHCYNTLVSVGTSTAQNAAANIYAKANSMLRKDLTEYREYYASNQKPAATQIANTANDAYLKTSGDEDGVASYSRVADLLVSWYIQEIYLPLHQEEVEVFDPTDKNQVDLSENVG